MSDLLAHVEAVWQAVVPDLPGFTVEVLPSIDSTSSELMRRARAGLMEPVLLAADEQTAGRGRLGKGWHSKAGQSLTFSLALPLAPADWSGLSLAVGVSLAESLHPDVRLKWPNDLWLHQRKLGGILVETASNGTSVGSAATHPRLVVVGVGINIARPEAAAVSALASPDALMPAMAPAGLSEVLVGLTAGEALARVAPALVRDIQAFESQGFSAFAERFARRDALQGQSVRLSDGTQGTACGVSPQGALLVQTDQGMQAVTSSEVSVRPC
ncbi:MAG TPA: biotin--[acetyl-CoA-carboxylase] ligase [Hydrogenophaga sp.]|uniref:biotin--[acetyl-CoA-carboxylase] ligase n=1 Tax=Hydrogenophaga sp. TaxID=1904254 RepID=UPI0008D45DB2|nr:biotin--[acetyl-CoA-carboxylase] ligase [Hydrogenophaga sp.]OGA78495.1 MAG: biotin--[acetyl-CoA-carboxylase] ligase [Burkholderiales bacterium GWE1_65_30]OGA92465.1 MAG: biotin--[acetyl-CoA-carboxylase] ligase [Burkholderiales bacterium GWF1_66_17]HAX22493.1 biotin--[acetyl-CoA-carboxylase] ligase [Hydrogenophaga sp.]HBU18038.1 biotin--[acetyl-CoA-carboxylase] ligase [Hydrogenophaga sp.]